MLLNVTRDAHLVWRGSDDTKTPPDFHRLLGGHVEFGEAALDAVQREILEETSSELLNPQLLGVLENRFVYRGRLGHEIVFVYSGNLNPPEPVPANGGWRTDNQEHIWVEWRPVVTDRLALPLYPEGVQELMAERHPGAANSAAFAPGG